MSGNRLVNKRRTMINQYCLEAMRDRHPEEYEAILQDVYQVIPGPRRRPGPAVPISQTRQAPLVATP